MLISVCFVPPGCTVGNKLESQTDARIRNRRMTRFKNRDSKTTEFINQAWGFQNQESGFLEKSHKTRNPKSCAGLWFMVVP